MAWAGDHQNPSKTVDFTYNEKGGRQVYTLDIRCYFVKNENLVFTHSKMRPRPNAGYCLLILEVFFQIKLLLFWIIRADPGMPMSDAATGLADPVDEIASSMSR